MINCGFTPPNCLKDLCTCPIAGAASGNNATSGNGTKGAKGEAPAEEAVSDFALAFERGANPNSNSNPSPCPSPNANPNAYPKPNPNPNPKPNPKPKPKPNPKPNPNPNPNQVSSPSSRCWWMMRTRCAPRGSRSGRRTRRRGAPTSSRPG